MSNENTARYHVRRREFLNENPELPAFIIAIVEDTRDIPDENEQAWKWGTVQLDFGDCYRRISFDFGLGDRVERANSLRKIRLLAEVINQVREAIELEVASRDARPEVLHLDEAVVA
jgi:hypothetical protein